MSNKLQVAGFLDNSLVNGKGLRSVLFLSGCKHNCRNCQNKSMQDFNYGDQVEIEEIINRINKNTPLIKGVTLSGGDPFEQADRLWRVAQILKEKGFNIWCYTGYVFEDIIEKVNKKQEWAYLINFIDVLVDGKFEEDKKDFNLKYKGSLNQRIIDVQKSLKDNIVALYKL